jgi:DNA-binding winged helix-turn-helix (wHTH) protein
MAALQQIELRRTGPDSLDFEVRSPMPGIPELARRARSGEVAFLFGSFRLLPTQRLLLSGGIPIRLGSRALDILIILTERAGELVSKDELMARVWPNIFVVPANLTVHITALRRALHERGGDGRYFVNIPGRGYHFVAPVVYEHNVGGSAVQARWTNNA